MSKETKSNETAETAQKVTAPAKAESAYKVRELAANAKKVFDTRPECVTAALKEGGKEQYTVSEAKTLVEKFLKKEVK